MPDIAFQQVDVFTQVRFKGNPVAVVMDGQPLSTEQMQQIANWTNLSETTFVLPPTEDADYRVRIFTPGAELPFAGHPTIGTAHALIEAGAVRPRDGRLIQQCKAGLIRLHVDGDGPARTIAFELPEARFTALDEAGRQELEGVLGASLKSGVAPLVVDVGPRWLVAQLESAGQVLALAPDFARMRQQDVRNQLTGVVAFGEYAPGSASRIEVRAFAPAHGIQEDPVCGSGNGAMAAFIRHTGQAAHFGRDFAASQGAVVGRAGVIRLGVSSEAIRVGGNAVTCISGVIAV